MKKFLAIAAMALVAFSSSAVAQEDDAETVSVTGTVIVPLELTVLHHMEFPDDMERSTTYTSHQGVPGSEEEWDENALLQLKGDGGDLVTWTWPATTPLTTGTATPDETMIATLSPQWWYTVNPIGGGGSYYTNYALYTVGSPIPLTGGPGGDGYNWMLIDGVVTTSATQARGPYTGTFIVSCDYFP
jgi:hypothetical protein